MWIRISLTYQLSTRLQDFQVAVPGEQLEVVMDEEHHFLLVDLEPKMHSSTIIVAIAVISILCGQTFV